MYDYHIDPFTKNNLFPQNREIGNELNKKLWAYLQAASHSITENKVYMEIK